MVECSACGRNNCEFTPWPQYPPSEGDITLLLTLIETCHLLPSIWEFLNHPFLSKSFYTSLLVVYTFILLFAKGISIFAQRYVLFILIFLRVPHNYPTISIKFLRQTLYNKVVHLSTE